MNLINPWAISLSLLGGFIILMYLLKLRRKRVDFSSTLLWMKSMEDLTANAPFQRLRQNLLMYLQLLFIALLSLGLAKPTMLLTRGKGTFQILLIDNSASMNAADGAGGGTRLDEAKSVARQMIDNMDTADQMMIVTFGGDTRVVQPFTSEKPALAAAVRDIPATDAEDAFLQALRLAQGTRNARDAAGGQTHVSIISDGGVGYLGNAIGEKEEFGFRMVGSRDDNRGIVSFDLRESFERDGKMQVFAEVENFGASPADVMMRAIVDERVVDVLEQRLEPGGREGFVFKNLESAERRAIRLELIGDDLLPSDDVARGWFNADASTRVLLVTTGNVFLESTLSVIPGLEISKVAPAMYEPTGAYDLTVFEQFIPEKLGPGRYLILDAVPPLSGFSAAAEPMKSQIALDWNRLHPITRFIRFDDLAAPEAIDLTSPDWMTTLVESPEGPLIQAGEYQGVKLVWIGFDPLKTYWPLEIGFPIFMANAVEWLAVQGEGSLTGNYRAGELVTLQADGEIEVRGPGGSWTLQPNENGAAFFSETYRAGIYEIRSKGEKIGEFAVNALSRKESDIKPKEAIVAGEQAIASGSLEKENRPVWQWFALAGLILLVAEWHLYCRRSWL